MLFRNTGQLDNKLEAKLLKQVFLFHQKCQILFAPSKKHLAKKIFEKNKLIQ